MGEEEERDPPGLWCWLGRDARKENEAAGFYHFEDTKPSMMEALSSRRPLSTIGPIEASRKKPYRAATPYPLLMTWDTQAWPYNQHQRCRSRHRFLVTPIIMAEAQVLRKNYTFLKGYAPEDSVGNIWVALCPTKGTSINITVLNQVFNYKAKILGNLYEVITTNDANSFYVAILVHTSSSTDAIVAKFWVQGIEVLGGFYHFVDPTNRPKLNKLRIIEGADSEGTIYKDGGTEMVHIPGSFSSLPNFTPIVRLDEIINKWDDAILDYRKQKSWTQNLSYHSREHETRWLTKEQMVLKWKGERAEVKVITSCLPSAARCLKAASKVDKYLSDTPYYSEPFFTTPPSRGMFPLHVETMVYYCRSHLFYNKRQWSLTNDKNYREGTGPVLHQQYHCVTGHPLEGSEDEERYFGIDPFLTTPSIPSK